MFGGIEDQVAHGRLGIVEKCGAPVAVGLIEVRPRAAGHQLAFQDPVLHQRDFLRADSFIVHAVSTDE